MEKEICNIQANEQKLKLEKFKLAYDLETKQALLKEQACEISKLRQDFSDQVLRAAESGEKWRKTLDSVDPKVCN